MCFIAKAVEFSKWKAFWQELIVHIRSAMFAEDMDATVLDDSGRQQ